MKKKLNFTEKSTGRISKRIYGKKSWRMYREKFWGRDPGVIDEATRWEIPVIYIGVVPGENLRESIQ